MWAGWLELFPMNAALNAPVIAPVAVEVEEPGSVHYGEWIIKLSTALNNGSEQVRDTLMSPGTDNSDKFWGLTPSDWDIITSITFLLVVAVIISHFIFLWWVSRQYCKECQIDREIQFNREAQRDAEFPVIDPEVSYSKV